MNTNPFPLTAALDAAFTPLLFPLGHPSLPSSPSLPTLLAQSLVKITDIFNLPDPHSLLRSPSTLPRILEAIFDATGSLKLVLDDSDLAESLDEHDRTCLYVQAVAGMVAVFRRLLNKRGREMTEGVLEGEVRVFAGSEERREILDKIAGKKELFSCCYTRGHVVEVVLEVVEGRDDEEEEEDEEVAVEEVSWGSDVRGVFASGGVREKFSSDTAAWEGERPCKNMGLPWGFTIMALN